MRFRTLSWSDWVSEEGFRILETELLPGYLQLCRWFGGKSRSISTISLIECIEAPNGSEWAIFLFKVEYVGGEGETYLLPLARVIGPLAKAIQLEAPAAVLAEWIDSEADTLLVEAVYAPDFQMKFLELIAFKDRWLGRYGAMIGDVGKEDAGINSLFQTKTDSFAGSHVLKAEQSNTSLIYPGRIFLKLLRRLEDGENLELETLRFLNEKTAFRGVPKFVGSVKYQGESGTNYSLAIAEGLVPAERNAWEKTLQLAQGYLNRLSENPRNIQVADPTLEFAQLLGMRTAEMHLALASNSEMAAFEPEAFTLDYQKDLAERMQIQTGLALDNLRKNLPTMAENRRGVAEQVLASRQKLMDAFIGLKESLISTVKIRVHGDYHLGQVLDTGQDIVILDFEGEPARTLAERKVKQSPWRDVAGMIRSFHYAIHSAWPESIQAGSEVRKTLEPWAENWFMAMKAAFLETYLKTSWAAAFVPTPSEQSILLKAFLMEKAAYELNYELNNRPDWVHIPLLGILSLLTA